MHFSQHFGLHHEQPELDFVDIDPRQDMRLFIDPYALSRRDDAWSQSCTEDIISFFQATIDAIRASDHARARSLLNNLTEPHETCLAVCRRERRYGLRDRGSAAEVECAASNRV